MPGQEVLEDSKEEAASSSIEVEPVESMWLVKEVPKEKPVFK